MNTRPNTIVTQRLHALEKMLSNKQKSGSQLINRSRSQSLQNTSNNKKMKTKTQSSQTFAKKNSISNIEEEKGLIDTTQKGLYENDSKLNSDRLQHMQNTEIKLKTCVNKEEGKVKKEVLELLMKSSIETNIKLSPFAAILASPMRTCTFHRKQYPSALLARFSIGIHPETGKKWGYPSINESGERGYYVKLNKQVIDILSKKEHKRLFRGSADFPKTGMSEYIENLLIERVIIQLKKIAPSLIPLKLEFASNQEDSNNKELTTSTSITDIHSKWQSRCMFWSPLSTSYEWPTPIHGFHCLFILSHYLAPDQINNFYHNIIPKEPKISRSIKEVLGKSVMTLDLREQPWRSFMNLLNNKMEMDPSSSPHFMAVAVPKTKENIPLMIDIWRLEQYFLSGEMKEKIIKKHLPI
ncbi:hypothetical protein BJ944DRAFT_263324 [Cunninghamella echinulata]|nr:hypothetical protein BJ944DRAFT_263324 [Cunninghamella echinulata]